MQWHGRVSGRRDGRWLHPSLLCTQVLLVGREWDAKPLSMGRSHPGLLGIPPRLLILLKLCQCWDSRKKPALAPCSSTAITFALPRQFVEMVENHYLSKQDQIKRHFLLANFFKGTWSWGKKKPHTLPHFSRTSNANRKLRNISRHFHTCKLRTRALCLQTARQGLKSEDNRNNSKWHYSVLSAMPKIYTYIYIFIYLNRYLQSRRPTVILQTLLCRLCICKRLLQQGRK